MSLSKNVMRELQRELAQAQVSRDHANARIRALEAILSDAAPAVGLREPAERGPRTKPTDAANQPSLRAAVIRRLELTSSAAIEVARHLEATGFRVGGTTSLRERVAHELSRLRRKGVLRRNRNGHYEIARSGGTVGTMAEPAPEERMALN